jgi:hypothetical protein
MSEINEELEDEGTLDKIRYFKGSFQDLKNLVDKKAKQNTNAMDEVEYEHPQKRKAKGTSPVYQTFGIVNNPNKVYEMKNLKTFDGFNEGEYYVMGFGSPTYGGGGGAAPAGYGLGWPDYRSYTGYTMSPVMGVVSTLTETLSKEAEMYEKDEDPGHTAPSYLKEAHKCIMEELKGCYDRHGVAEEMWESEMWESELYEFDAAKKTQVIKDRNTRNQQRMQMAKVKGDKQGEKMYQLKLQIDQIDLQKTKLKDEISKISAERRAQREKIQSIAK